MTENADMNENSQEPENTQKSGMLPLLLIAGLTLIFAGIIAVIAATALGSAGTSASGGIIIFIGPFPLVFGAGPDAPWLILIGVILAIISFVSFILLRRRV